MKLIDKLKEYFNKEEEVEIVPEESMYEKIIKEMEYYQEEIMPEVEKLKGHTHFLKTETEDKILKWIEEDPDCLRDRTIASTNIGMYAAEVGLDKVVLRCLDDDVASTQVDHDGMNIGMYAAQYGLEDCVIKALNNKVASLQQDVNGCNLGMYAAIYELKVATLKALDNHEASIQQNDLGNNIGIISAKYGMEKCVLKALENIGARQQFNRVGETILSIAEERGLTEVLEGFKEIKERENKMSDDEYYETYGFDD